MYRVDPGSGSLHCVQVVGDLINPSFLAVGCHGTVLYTVHGDQQEASALAIDPDTGLLRPLNQQSTHGQNPVHLALDPAQQHLIVSNHIGASLAVLPVAADGSLLPLSQLVRLDGKPGPHRVEQSHAKPHANPFDPSGQYVVVPDKGLDCIFVFRFQEGRLVPAAVPSVQAREGSGPRHIVFHPSLPCAYCINELDSTVVAYAFDACRGTLQPLQVLSVLPDSFTGNSRAAEIAVDPTGRFVYASNRGHDSIAVFAIEDDDGRLRQVSTIMAGGKTPRFVTMSPTGRHFYVLNEDSDSIAVFAVDACHGTLHPAGAAIPCASPVCMVFAP